METKRATTMTLTKLQQNLKAAVALFPTDTEIEVTFSLTYNGQSKHVSFNTCTVYLDNFIVDLSLEGETVEIFRTTTKEQGHELL